MKELQKREASSKDSITCLNNSLESAEAAAETRGEKE